MIGRVRGALWLAFSGITITAICISFSIVVYRTPCLWASCAIYRVWSCSMTQANWEENRVTRRRAQVVYKDAA